MRVINCLYFDVLTEISWKLEGIDQVVFDFLLLRLSKTIVKNPFSYPPANGASLGSYLVKNWLFCQKEWKWADHTCKSFLKRLFSLFYFTSPEIMEVIRCSYQDLWVLHPNNLKCLTYNIIIIWFPKIEYELVINELLS